MNKVKDEFYNVLERLLLQVSNHKLTVRQAADLIYEEIGRGGRILRVDKNLRVLDGELAEMNYTVQGVDLNLRSDEENKKHIDGEVLITRNGKRFVKDAKKYSYGLIWIVSKGSNKTLAKKVAKVLLSPSFRRNPVQVVKV